MFFHKNRNTQIQVYTIQRLELKTGKNCDACSIVHWQGVTVSSFIIVGCVTDFSEGGGGLFAHPSSVSSPEKASKEGGTYFKEKRNYSQKISKPCNFLFQNNKN